MFHFYSVPSSPGRTQMDRPTSPRHPLRLGDSPDQRLPGEVILKIIGFVLEDCDSGRPGDLATLASHICTHWRAFIIGCPSLWTHISINNILSPELNLERAVTFIQRSKELPLTVTIEAKPGYVGGELLSVTGAIANLITPHMHRVREYHLTYTDRSRIDDVMGMLPRSLAPLLEAFSIRCLGPRCMAPLLLPCLQPPAASGVNWRESTAIFPALQDLRFFGASPRWSACSVQNLRSLVLYDLGASAPTWLELREVLHASAPTLRTLAITNSFPVNPGALTCDLPVLESLTLGDNHPFSAERFIATVAVPSLTELALLDTHRSWINEQVQGVGQTNALVLMMQRLPLHQIHTLSLSHLGFLRTAGPHGGLMTAADCEATPRALFSRLHQLQNLRLVHPDVHTVNALVRPPYLVCSTGHPEHPMPLLSHMTIECVDERVYMYILYVLQKRVTVGPASPPARRLEEMTVRLQPQPWEHMSLDPEGFKMFAEIAASKVIYKHMENQCPALPGYHDDLRFF